MEKSEKEKIAELIIEIGSEKMLRIERWRDEHKHWRAGIEWYGEEQYEAIVEKPTLLECLETLKQHLHEKK